MNILHIKLCQWCAHIFPQFSGNFYCWMALHFCEILTSVRYLVHERISTTTPGKLIFAQKIFLLYQETWSQARNKCGILLQMVCEIAKTQNVVETLTVKVTSFVTPSPSQSTFFCSDNLLLQLLPSLKRCGSSSRKAPCRDIPRTAHSTKGEW